MEKMVLKSFIKVRILVKSKESPGKNSPYSSFLHFFVNEEIPELVEMQGKYIEYPLEH